VTPNGVIGLAGRWVAIGSGAMTLPLIYIEDVIDALLQAAEAPDAVGRVFNVVDTHPVTQQAYLDRCRRKLGDEIKVVRTPAWLFMLLGFGVEILRYSASCCAATCR
jgi:2-alkyl-3-oxoalkanoate reductase